MRVMARTVDRRQQTAERWATGVCRLPPAVSSEYSLRRWNLHLVRVQRHGLPQRASEGLEGRLDQMVRIRPVRRLEVHRELGVRRDGAEELLGELRLEPGDRHRWNLRIEAAARPARDIDRAPRP